MCPLFIVNGGWNAWSGLSACTRSCGGVNNAVILLLGIEDVLGSVSELFHTVATHTDCCPGALTHKKTKKNSYLSVLTRDQTNLDVSLLYPYCDQYTEEITAQYILSDLRVSSNLISE